MHGKKWALAVVAVVGLVGCGGEEARVYDVELDAAALSNVPTRCGQADAALEGPAENLAAQQRWTLRNDAMRATTLEVPDLDFRLPLGSYRFDADDAPDVLDGTSPEMGALQYVDLRQRSGQERGILDTFRIYIDPGDLEEGIQGHIWLRRSELGVAGSECVSYVPFTGRRVAQ